MKKSILTVLSIALLSISINGFSQIVCDYNGNNCIDTETHVCTTDCNEMGCVQRCT